MPLDTLHALMVHELKDLYSAERQLVQALPKMAKAATDDALRTAITNHLEETKEHVSRIEQVLDALGESQRGQKCKGMEGLIEEGKSLLEEDATDEVLDAGIVAAAQRVEHYEIAAYGCVIEYARLMGHDDAVELLQQTLDEEKQADTTLSQIAESGLNALANGPMDEDADDSSTSPRKTTPKSASPRARESRRPRRTNANS